MSALVVKLGGPACNAEEDVVVGAALAGSLATATAARTGSCQNWHGSACACQRLTKIKTFADGGNGIVFQNTPEVKLWSRGDFNNVSQSFGTHSAPWHIMQVRMSCRQHIVQVEQAT